MANMALSRLPLPVKINRCFGRIARTQELAVNNNRLIGYRSPLRRSRASFVFGTRLKTCKTCRATKLCNNLNTCEWEPLQNARKIILIIIVKQMSPFTQNDQRNRWN